MIDLFKPFMPDIPDIESILTSNALSFGKYTIKFENALKLYFNTPYVIVTNNFASAISVATTALGLSFGDEVIISPMSCLVSTQSYLSSGFKIKWCDIDPNRGTMDPDYLKKIISSKTKLIIHNHFCGYPGYINEINEIGREYGIPVIDDGIECFGSEYEGKKIGNCGTDITIFSFSAVRIPNTIEGGAVIFKDKRTYEKSLRIRDCGIDRNIFRDDLGEINPLCDIKDIGFNAMMSNVNGYIGSQQMKIIDQLITKQRNNAKKLEQLVSNDKNMVLLNIEKSKPNYWVFGLLVDKKREAIKYFRDKGLFASGVHINNNIYSVFGNNTKLEGVEKFYNHFIALPSGWWIEDYPCL